MTTKLIQDTTADEADAIAKELAASLMLSLKKNMILHTQFTLNAHGLPTGFALRMDMVALQHYRFTQAQATIEQALREAFATIAREELEKASVA